MPNRTANSRAELLNFVLAGKLDWTPRAQKAFPGELAKRYPQLGGKELARCHATCQAAIARAEEVARALVDVDGYPYLAADRELLQGKWENALLTEFDWIDLQNLTRLCSHAMAGAYQEERVKRG